jgi:glycosyltransferase involved in cell wall biosynthesis
MKFSIVTISYNQAEFLERAIQSVLNQNNVEIEYIIVDPGSTDGSKDIINKYKKDFKCIITDPDNGPPDGLNKGFKHATGDVYGFLNSDDEFIPGAFEAISTAFDKYTSDIITGHGYFIDSHGKLIKRIIPTKIAPRRYVFGGSHIFQQGTFFTKESFIASGGFNVNNRTCWDGELFLKMAILGYKHKVIKSEVAMFRIHSKSITGTGRLEKEYSKDTERLFIETIGRPRGTRDVLPIWFYKLYNLPSKLKNKLFNQKY